MENDIFWSEIWEGFGEPGSTPPPGVLHGRQEPITWSEQLPCTLVKAFSRTSLFLGFLREFLISFKFHKPVSKTYKPKNDTLCFLTVTFSFPFAILYFEWAHRHGEDSVVAGKT